MTEHEIQILTSDEITAKLKSVPLSKEEENEYRASIALGEGKIPPEEALKIFNLFLNGSTTETMWRINDHKYSKGQIVAARLDGKWDEKVNQYTETLLAKHMERIHAVNIESANFLADMISAANRLNGDKILKYLQTDDASQLGDLQISSLQGYKTAIELLASLTQGDKKRGPVVKPGRPAKDPAPTPYSTENKPDEVTKPSKEADLATLVKAIRQKAKVE